jgi:hypothetical protein
MVSSTLLTARGLRTLAANRGVLKTGRRFVALEGLFDAAKCRALLERLERYVAPHLTAFEQPIPPETVWGLTENYAETLPKTVRCRTVTLASRSKGARAVEQSGALDVLKATWMRELAEGLSGRKLRRGWGTQVLAYGPGDYAGPHHDHHPEEPLARDGYTDVHLTLCTKAVRAQTLVYAPRDHFSEQASVARSGTLTAYRLPFWHYTTPLQGGPTARRWVLLATFLDA